MGVLVQASKWKQGPSVAKNLMKSQAAKQSETLAWI
jgi:hypothetical protein